MADACGQDAWSHTAALLCLTANVSRDPKKHRPFRPDDFDPYARQAKGRAKAGIPLTAGNVGMLKDVFVAGGREPPAGKEVHHKDTKAQRHRGT